MIEFGTGGWRAIIGDGFTRENLQGLALAVARRMKAEDVADRGFCIGYDRRFLSVQAAEWVCEVMAAEGVHTRIIHREAPTPMIMFTVHFNHMPYGMAVTASHNPALYNGVKLFTAGGRDAAEDITGEIADAANAIAPEEIRLIPYAQAIREGLVEEINPQNAYLDSIIRTVNMDAIRSRNLSIVLDPMYGVSRTSLQTILLTARCDVSVIHERHDTLFGGRLPAPNVETLGALRAAVMESHADIGIATDGDADRLGIIDNAGRFIHPNEILCLLYNYLLKYKGWHGCAVRNLATTHLLDAIAAAYGEKCYEVPVGFKYVSAAMQEHNAVIGGESSGGLTVRGHIHGKDGIYAAALLVEMLSVTGKKLSELVQELYDTFGRRYMTEYDWAFDAKDKPRLLALLSGKELPVFPQAPTGVNDTDGRKILFANGWLIVRFSGTEPRLRVFCEMPTLAEAEQFSRVMADYLGLAFQEDRA
ncbi:MAG TPA: phosphoglucomutase/phosphomannomutase family protein [Candidatus Limiplasma sp.]|nr:phosphoglucomutase/phosphomannomutase family protein [Candidatus Limiplasma sp.]